MISLSLIPIEKIRDARLLVDELEKAVDDGAVGRADELTNALLALGGDKRAIQISDESWMNFNREVRVKIPDYEAAYLVNPQTCSRLLHSIDMDEMENLRAELEAAAASNSHLLQIPSKSL